MQKLSDREIREQIVEISKTMYSKGLVNAFEGNVSYFDGKNIYMTPSQVCKGLLKEDMLVVIDMDGKIIKTKDGYVPSSEYKMHLACYRLRPDIKSVVHTHSPYATAYALAGKPITTKAYPEVLILYGQIPLSKYGTPSTDDIYAGFADVIKDRYEVFLIENHGIISMGKDLTETYLKIEAAENIAKVLTITNQIGGEKQLPEDELIVLQGMREAFLKSKTD